jgi:UDP:flavonoid glycosyltransferase YjiC (YdhE family)
MDALLIPLGSTGDVLPFCALGRALAARGHRVRVAANPHFASMVQRAGLAFVPVGRNADYAALVQSAAFMDRRRGFGRLMSFAAEQIAPVHALVAAAAPSLVVAHPLAFGARVAEAELGVRVATAVLSPAFLHSAHQPPVLAGIPNAAFLPGWYKHAVAWMVDRLIVDREIGPAVNRFRRSRGLPPLRRVFRDGFHDGHLFLALFPAWFAPPQPDWPRNLTIANFPLYEDGDAATLRSLRGWLEDGTPPVVFTPGTAHRHARRFFATAVAAAARLGRRALLLTRFADHLPHPLPAHVRHVSYLPLGRVLRRASALVHHGGIGTSAAGLAAGVPQLVTPLAHDQLDNAARLFRLGISCSISPQRFEARRVAATLDRLLACDETAARCRHLKLRLAITSPLAAAVAALESYAGPERATMSRPWNAVGGAA